MFVLRKFAWILTPSLKWAPVAVWYQLKRWKVTTSEVGPIEGETENVEALFGLNQTDGSGSSLVQPYYTIEPAKIIQFPRGETQKEEEEKEEDLSK